MSGCKYRTLEDGRLAYYNEHPTKVNLMYRIKIRSQGLNNEHEQLMKFVSELESKLFLKDGTRFVSWCDKNRGNLEYAIRFLGKMGEYGELETEFKEDLLELISS